MTDHVHKLELTLNKLKESGLKCNIEDYLFGQTEMEYLGFWVTRDVVKLINAKIEAIKNMMPMTYQNSAGKFIGLVNYYRYMW